MKDRQGTQESKHHNSTFKAWQGNPLDTLLKEQNHISQSPAFLNRKGGFCPEMDMRTTVTSPVLNWQGETASRAGIVVAGTEPTENGEYNGE